MPAWSNHKPKGVQERISREAVSELKAGTRDCPTDLVRSLQHSYMGGGRGGGLEEEACQRLSSSWGTEFELEPRSCKFKVSFSWQHQPCPTFQNSPAAAAATASPGSMTAMQTLSKPGLSSQPWAHHEGPSTCLLSAADT